MPDTVHIRHLEPGYCIATWDGVLIQIWRGPATLERTQKWQEIGRSFLSERSGTVCSSLSIVDSRSPAPSEKVRLAMATSFNALAAGMRRHIVLGDGSALRSSLVRGVGLTLSLFSSAPLRLEFPASIDEAALILAREMSPDAGGVEALKAAVSRLRSHLDD